MDGPCYVRLERTKEDDQIWKVSFHPEGLSASATDIDVSPRQVMNALISAGDLLMTYCVQKGWQEYPDAQSIRRQLADIKELTRGFFFRSTSDPTGEN